MLGGQGSPYLPAGEWQGSIGYRWQHSDRHFTGSHEDLERNTEQSQVVNDLNLLDFGITRAFTDRLSASFSLPVVLATRTSPIRNAAGTEVIDHDTQHANGIGDMSLLGSAWLLKPSEHPNENIAIGAGVKFPTGDSDIRHHVFVLNRTTGIFVDQERTVDQSITTGDGGFGAIVDVRAFKLLFQRPNGFGLTLYANGTYLFNPRNTNGVPTFRGGSGEAVMSVSDQYLARLGFAFPLLPRHGLSFSLGGRIEGVPVRDLIGKSDGFRRPGFAVSIEPGLVWAVGKNTFGVSTPVALFRDRLRSVPDMQATPERHGDAAFADFMVLFSYTRLLGRSPLGSEPEPAAAPAPAAAPGNS